MQKRCMNTLGGGGAFDTIYTYMDSADQDVVIYGPYIG